MKHRLFLIIATLVGLGSITTSCSWDDELVVANNDGDQKTPISFNVNIGSLPDPEVTTRSNDPLGANASKATRGYSATTTTGVYHFWKDDVVSIGIQGVSNSSRNTSTEVVKKYKVSAAGDANSNIDLEYKADYDDNTTFKFDWLGTDEVVCMRAWSYGTNDTPGTDPVGAQFTIVEDQNVDITDADGKRGSIKELLYGARANYKNANSINIPLYHQLSRVVINVKSQVSTLSTISSVKVGKDNLPMTAEFVAPNGDTYNKWLYTYGKYLDKYDPDPENSTDTRDKDGDAKDANVYGSWKNYASALKSITPKEWSSATSGYDKSYTAVMLPYNYAANTEFIDIELSGVTNHYIYKLGSETTFKPGYQYTFNITLLDEVRFKVTVTVTAWDTSNDPAPTYNF